VYQTFSHKIFNLFFSVGSTCRRIPEIVSHVIHARAKQHSDQLRMQTLLKMVNG